MNKVYEQFQKDLAKARPAENMVKLVLEDAFKGKDVKFNNVASDSRYYHNGDIEVVFDSGRKHQFIDVKDDGVIFVKSTNLNAEDRTKKPGKPIRDGFMRTAKYNVVAYHSKATQRVLLVDFKRWKEVYKKRSYLCPTFMRYPYVKKHKNGEVTYSYFNPIEKLKDEGIVMAEIDYDYSGKYENPSHVECISIKKYGKHSKAS